jgi:hypothetical protein
MFGLGRPAWIWEQGPLAFTSLRTVSLTQLAACLFQVIAIGEYRTQLYDYLKARMNAVAPNLTIMVGELVGARLIAHAGSLMNLAKYPASTGVPALQFVAIAGRHASLLCAHLEPAPDPARGDDVAYKC